MASTLTASASVAANTSAAGFTSKQSETASTSLAASFKPICSPSVSSLSVTSLKPVQASRNVAAQVATESSAETSKQTGTRYYFVVANAKFMLDEEEHFQEQLKERKRWIQESGHEHGFWLLFEPEFLESFPEISKRVSRPAVALVSTDKDWIQFMKIRLDRVLMGEFDCDTLEEAIKAKPVSVDYDVPKNWVAPYTKYPKDWWKPYVPN